MLVNGGREDLPSPRERAVKIQRRAFLNLATGALALPAISRRGWAQSYPTKPIRMVVQVAGGSAPDVVARVIGTDWLSKRLGQPVVMDNRPGASGNIGTEHALRSEPDGYTLLFCMSANTINPSLFTDLRFNFLKDAEPVALIGPIPLVMEVHPSVPAETIPELIKYAKANPNKLSMASSGNGTPLHVGGELFQIMAGVKMLHVPYRGEPTARPDLLSGRVQVMFGVVPTSLPHFKSRKMRALAVSTEKRLDVLPDVPAMAEFLPGFEASGWYGIAAPKGTPRDIVELLNKEINAGLADPKIQARLADLGTLVRPGSTDDFRKFIAGEVEKWGKVIKTAGIKPQ